MAAGGGAAGGGKLSGAEKSLYAQQENLLKQEEARLNSLQQSLYSIQPQQFNLLGMNPQTGQFISPTERGPAPTPVADPGLQENYFTANNGKSKNRVATGRTIKSGQGQGQQEVRLPNSIEIAKYNAEKAKYQTYLAAQKQYDEWTPNSANAMPQPNIQRQQEADALNQVLAGNLQADTALKQGQYQAQGAILAQLLQRSNEALSPTGQMQQTIDQSLGKYQGLLANDPNQALIDQFKGRISDYNTGRSPQAATLNTILGNYNSANPNQALVDQFSSRVSAYNQGNSPEADLIRQFEQRVQTGLEGKNPINPQIAEELSQQEQSIRNRMQRLQGPGWETSTAGIQTLGDFGRQRAGVIDELNRQDIAQALSGYGGLVSQQFNEQQQNLSGFDSLTQLEEQRKSGLMSQYLGLAGQQTAEQQQNLQGYGGLVQLSEQQKNQALGQYLSMLAAQGTQLGADLQQYTGLLSATESSRMQQYINEMTRRTGLADLFSGVTTQPLTGVNFSQLAQAYGQAGAQQSAAQNAGGGGGGTNWAAIGSLAGTTIGAIGGSFFGPGGTMAGAALGGAVGGLAGGAAGGTGAASGGGGGSSPNMMMSNPFPMSNTASNLGGGYITPQGQTYYGNQGGYTMGNFSTTPRYY